MADTPDLAPFWRTQVRAAQKALGTFGLNVLPPRPCVWGANDGTPPRRAERERSSFSCLGAVVNASVLTSLFAPLSLPVRVDEGCGSGARPGVSQSAAYLNRRLSVPCHTRPCHGKPIPYRRKLIGQKLE